MTLGALSFFHRRPHRRSAVVKADSLELESSSGGDHSQSHAPRSSRSGTLTGRAQEGSPSRNTVLKVLQLRKEATAAGQPLARPSHDSILDSGWAGASDPSYSNRPSMEGGRPPSPSCSSVGALMEREFDATSAPSCSARSSLDLEGPCCPCYGSCGCTRSARSSTDCGGGRTLPAARRLMLQQPACSCARAGELMLLGGAAAVGTAARAGSLPAEVPGAGFLGSGSGKSNNSGLYGGDVQRQAPEVGEEQLHPGEATGSLGDFCTATRPAPASCGQSVPSRSSSLKSSIAALAVLRAAARSAVEGAPAGGRGGPGLPRAVPSAAAEVAADLWAGASSCPTGGMLARETDGESAAASVAGSSRATSRGPSRAGSGAFGLPAIIEGQISQPQRREREAEQQEGHGSGQEQQQAQQRERLARSPPKSPFFAASRLAAAAAGATSRAAGVGTNGSAGNGSPHPSLPYEHEQVPEQQQPFLTYGAQAAGAGPNSLPGTINVSKTTHSTAALLELFKAQQQQGQGQLSGGSRSVASTLASPPGYSPVTSTPSASVGPEPPEHKLTMEVHGTYGCHIMEDRPCHSLSQAAQASLEDAIHAASRLHRSSIDLLLNQGPPAVVMVQRRPSMELPELLGPPGRPGQAKDSRLSLDSNSSRTSRGGRRSGGLLTAASALLPSQAHARSNGSLASAVSFLTPQQRSQLPGQLPAGAAAGEDTPADTPAAASAFAEVDKALPRGMLHAASTNMLADLSPNDFMGVTSPTAAAAASQAALGLGPSASAFASSVVDTASGALGEASFNSKRRSEGLVGPVVGTPQDLWLSPELHDTFGAHALWPPEPAVPPSTPPASPYGGTRGGSSAGGAAAMAGRRPSRGGGISPRSHQRHGPDALGVLAQQRQPSPGDSASCVQPRASAAVAGSGLVEGAGRDVERLGNRDGGGGSTQAPPAGSGGFGRRGKAAQATTTKLHHPATVPGQQSVMMTDPQNSVPPLECLRQRRAARQRLDSEGASGGGGYIAEAKRVLSQAMSSADPLETLLVQSSHSGAIGPLLRHLSQLKDDDAALRAGLHTLSLIITNSPNKSIIISFKGQQMLFDILYSTKDLEIQEDIVQLLWDLESTSEVTTCKDCVPDVKCFYAFLSILERTRRPAIASHVIHFMYGFRHIPCPGHILAEGARRLVGVVGAYRYHLPDAAQYTVGLLLAAMLDEPVMPEHDEHAVADQLLHLLAAPRSSAQCQAVLTLLSCISANTRARAALSHCSARTKLLQFGQTVGDARLRARALSLVKVLNKQELVLHT